MGVTEQHADEKTPIFTVHRKSYILSIWAEHQADGASVWRGCLETTMGQRTYFVSLTDLNRLLHDLGGWTDSNYPC